MGARAIADKGDEESKAESETPVAAEDQDPDRSFIAPVSVCTNLWWRRAECPICQKAEWNLSSVGSSTLRQDMSSRTVQAPPGKLGVVIDTNSDGPMVGQPCQGGQCNGGFGLPWRLHRGEPASPELEPIAEY